MGRELLTPSIIDQRKKRIIRFISLRNQTFSPSHQRTKVIRAIANFTPFPRAYQRITADWTNTPQTLVRKLNRVRDDPKVSHFITTSPSPSPPPPPSFINIFRDEDETKNSRSRVDQTNERYHRSHHRSTKGQACFGSLLRPGAFRMNSSTTSYRRCNAARLALVFTQKKKKKGKK